MIDDTQETVAADYSSTLSQEVLQIIEYQSDRHNALDWAKNLRFLAFDEDLYLSESGDLPCRQDCSHCHAKPRSPPSLLEYIDAEILHVCDKPFHNNHKISEEDWKTHPQRFTCDVCELNIFHGSRHHCGECLSGNYDICDTCLGRGKHCLDVDHRLETTAVFEFGDCVHVNARSCKDCESIPIFPSDSEVTKFRIVQLAEAGAFSSCDHFIAVSYCWPSPEYDVDGNMIQHQGRYDVTDEHGRNRKNRAPEDVITRAVQFAVQNGIRLVWIDQECIDQENPADKELGIQAMDKVYQRAFLSIGLLRTVLDGSGSLEGLRYLLAESGELQKEITDNTPSAEIVDVVMSFFEPLINDSWHSRAWILQEAFSAGSRMCLLIQHNQGINIKDFPGISRILSKTELVIQLDLFLILIDYARGYLTRALINLPVTDPLSERRANLLKHFRNFIPGEERSIQAKWTHQAGKTKPRRSCNAAVAMSYLRTKQITHIPDRLAILANLCNYDIRLDTIKLEEKLNRLSTCILALALINRDFSLFYPEVYNNLTNNRLSNLVESDFSWMTVTASQFQHLDARNIHSLTHYFHYFPASKPLCRKGLNVNGYLWKIYRRIQILDFSTFTNARDWFRTRHSVNVFNAVRSTAFTPGTWKEIEQSKIFQELDQEKKDEFKSSISKGDGLTAEKYDEWTSNLRAKIIAQLPEHYEIYFQAITSVYLVKVLYFLREKNELEVADAIWQSIRKDNWEIRLSVAENQARGWFNSVADFPPITAERNMPMTVQVMVDMLQLDSSRDGGFLQCWLVDAVMKDGWVAVGKFVRVSGDGEFKMHEGWIENANDLQMERKALEEKTIHSEVMNNEDKATPLLQYPIPEIAAKSLTSDIQSASTIASLDVNSSQALTTPAPAQSDQPFDFSTHGDTQLFSQLMKSSFLSLIEDLPSRNLANRIPLPLDMQTSLEMQNIFGAAMLYGRMDSAWREAEKGEGLGRLGSMRAIFDVNALAGRGIVEIADNESGEKKEREKIIEGKTNEGGDKDGEVELEPIWILTPYDERTERLPHTESRAMSMSWVVEPTKECPDEREGPLEVFKTKGDGEGYVEADGQAVNRVPASINLKRAAGFIKCSQK